MKIGIIVLHVLCIENLGDRTPVVSLMVEHMHENLAEGEDAHLSAAVGYTDVLEEQGFGSFVSQGDDELVHGLPMGPQIAEIPVEILPPAGMLEIENRRFEHRQIEIAVAKRREPAEIREKNMVEQAENAAEVGAAFPGDNRGIGVVEEAVELGIRRPVVLRHEFEDVFHMLIVIDLGIAVKSRILTKDSRCAKLAGSESVRKAVKRRRMQFEFA